MHMKKRLVILVLVLCLFLSLAVPAAAAGPVRGKVVAMTFDDGPNTNITPVLLDELAARKVKCTFFVLGRFALSEPEIVARAHSEGHQIASHTYNHMYLPQQSNAVIQQEVWGTRDVLADITGENSFMIRVPYGGYTERVLGLCEAPVILWSVDPTGGKSDYTEESLYRGLLKQAHDGAIILLHDTSNSNMRAALRAIDTLQEQGYTFVTVEELFRIKGVEPQNGTVYRGVYDDGKGFDEANLSNHWAYDSIKYVQDNKLMEGDGQGFKPNEYLTRAMAVTILWRACGSPSAASETAFTDIEAGSWYADAVAWGQEKGIVYGVSETSFDPHSMVSREQMCAFLIRLAQVQGRQIPETGEAGEYCDEFRISDWAKESVYSVLNGGFVSANETSALRPTDSLTRAEAAELLSWYHRVK